MLYNFYYIFFQRILCTYLSTSTKIFWLIHIIILIGETITSWNLSIIISNKTDVHKNSSNTWAK